jgi:LuxR family maltose regulon positive regulatory protein
MDAGGQPWPISGRVLIHLAEVALERNDLEAASQRLSEGMPLAAQVSPNWNLDGCLLQARLRQSFGDLPGAREALDEAHQIAMQSETPLDDIFAAVYEARLDIAEGRLAEAHRRLALPGPGQRQRPGFDMERAVLAYYLRELRQMVEARLLLAEGKAAEAHTLLEPLLESAEGHGRTRGVIEILMLQALALDARQPASQKTLAVSDKAMAALERALTLAEPEGYVRLFLDEGAPMARLLDEAARRGAAPGYARRLLAAFPTSLPAPHLQSQIPGLQALAEPLSDREREVLRLVAEGLSNQEIAERLVLSPNTVKVHTYNLYDKLNVHSRTQAVGRARALGLLSSE